MAQKLGIFGYFALYLHNFCIFSHQMIKKCAQKAYLVICFLNCKKDQIWNSLIHHTDKNGYFGTFWRLLTTFGIENGSMITLLISSCLNFAKTMCNVEVDIIKLKIIWPLWSFFTFWKFLSEVLLPKNFNFVIFQSHMDPPTWGWWESSGTFHDLY